MRDVPKIGAIRERTQVAKGSLPVDLVILAETFGTMSNGDLALSRPRDRIKMYVVKAMGEQLTFQIPSCLNHMWHKRINGKLRHRTTASRQSPNFSLSKYESTPPR